MTKALALISGGLDSLLAAKVILNQGIHVEGIKFFTGFCHGKHTASLRPCEKIPKKTFVQKINGHLQIPIHEIDISNEVKSERLICLVDVQRKINYEKNQAHIGKSFEVLVEGRAKKPDQLMGRNDGNKIVVFPDRGQKAGDIVDVRIEEVTPNTLIGAVV